MLGMGGDSGSPDRKSPGTAREACAASEEKNAKQGAPANLPPTRGRRLCGPQRNRVTGVPSGDRYTGGAWPLSRPQRALPRPGCPPTPTPSVGTQFPRVWPDPVLQLHRPPCTDPGAGAWRPRFGACPSRRTCPQGRSARRRRPQPPPPAAPAAPRSDLPRPRPRAPPPRRGCPLSLVLFSVGASVHPSAWRIRCASHTGLEVPPRSPLPPGSGAPRHGAGLGQRAPQPPGPRGPTATPGPRSPGRRPRPGPAELPGARSRGGAAAADQRERPVQRRAGGPR